jgi:hypothetical protein
MHKFGIFSNIEGLAHFYPSEICATHVEIMLLIGPNDPRPSSECTFYSHFSTVIYKRKVKKM